MQKFKARIILLGVLLFGSIDSFGQSPNEIKILQVINEEGKPIPQATIQILESHTISNTNSDGYYVVPNLIPGNYTLKISSIGYLSQIIPIHLLPERNPLIIVKLKINTTSLQELKVSSSHFGPEIPIVINKSGIKSMDLPQSSGTVSRKVIEDQQIQHLGDAVRNVSGVSLTQTRGGVGETFTARGYSIGIGGGAGSIFKNGVLVNTAGFPDASALESIEILKGSTALLYGNVSGGLIINMITRKPKFEKGGEISMRYGSYNEYKPTLDVYGPVSKNLAFRILSTYNHAESYRNGVKTESFYLNPSLNYKSGKKTKILLEGDFLNMNLTPDWGIGSLNNGQSIPFQVPRSQFINTSWAYFHLVQFISTLRLESYFQENLKLTTLISAQNTKINSYGSSLPNNVSANGDWNRGLAKAKTFEGDYSLQSFINWKFKTLGKENQFLWGIDLGKVSNYTNGFSIGGKNISAYTYDQINTLNLNKFNVRKDIPLAIDTAQIYAPVIRFGAYLQDLIILSHHLKLLAGIRWSWQKTPQTQIQYFLTNSNGLGTAGTKIDKDFSPKVSLLFQPNSNHTIYISYANNFIVNTGTDVTTGQGLRPSVLDQYELGWKSQIWDKKAVLSLIAYRIINNDLAVISPFKEDGVTINSDNMVKTFSGQTTSDGLEMDFSGNLKQGLFFNAGYSYNFARYTKTSGLKGSYIKGEQLVINPRNTANGSLYYTLKLKEIGLKLGISGFYTGFRLAGYNNVVGQIQNYNRLLPIGGYTTYDLSAGFIYHKFSWINQISNISNTLNYLIHDNYSITPIPPRQYLTTFLYKF